MIRPSEHSYGTLLGVELPPVRVISSPASHQPVDRSAWYDNLIVQSQRVTVGDLFGYYREEPTIGYVPEENAISPNGWWQSNNVGARRRDDVPEQKPTGKMRILVFGDSNAHGSRVRQEEAWTAVMESSHEDLQVLNFAVDGYGMAQSLLRYRDIKDRLDYDLVVLVFVPSADLWRDINTLRQLGEDGWDLDQVMPRFVLDQGKLRLIRSPYADGASMVQNNSPVISEELRDHLSSYDRFYFKSYYEEPGLLGRTVLYKLIAQAYFNWRKGHLRNSLLAPNSEAMQVSKKIFETMSEEARDDGSRFWLVLLPAHRDLARLERDLSYHDTWDRIVASLCDGEVECIDLSEGFLQASRDQWDQGFDGTHYGPKANRLIAELVGRQLMTGSIDPE